MTAPGGGAGVGAAGAVPGWRWRRPDPGDPFPLWCAPVPGPLGADGVTVELTRSAYLRRACPTCGRRSYLWSAMLQLPAPWGPLGAFQGCTRAHAVALVPVRWRPVAEGFVLAAAAVAAEGRTSPWHRQQIARYRDLAARAAWLDDRPPAWRTLALTLWAGSDLDLEQTAAIVAAALAEPPVGPQSASAARGAAAPGG